MSPTKPYGEQLREDPEWTELARQAHLLQQPPWSFSGKWISQAMEAIKAGRVALGTPASVVAEIAGEGGEIYTITGNTCNCPARKMRKECYHPTAAELYRLYHGKMRLTSSVPREPGDDALDDEDDGYIPEPDEGSPLLYSETQDTPLPIAEEDTMQSLSFPESIAVNLAVPELLIRHAGAVMQEAPFSMNLTVETPKGFTPQFTVRAQTEDEFKHRIIALLKMCEEKQYVPRRSRQDMAAAQPASATAAMAPAMPPTTNIPMCEYHGAMKASEKAPGTFFCTKKMGDGSYCKQKWPQA